MTGLPFLVRVHRSAVLCSKSHSQPSRRSRPDLGGAGPNSEKGGAQSGWGGRGKAGRNGRDIEEPRPVPLRQCPGAARPSRPRPTVVLERAYPGTPQSQSSNPLGLKTTTLFFTNSVLRGWGTSQEHRAARVGVAAGGESGGRYSSDRVCGGSLGVLGPYLRRAVLRVDIWVRS